MLQNRNYVEWLTCEKKTISFYKEPPSTKVVD